MGGQPRGLGLPGVDLHDAACIVANGANKRSADEKRMREAHLQAIAGRKSDLRPASEACHLSAQDPALIISVTFPFFTKNST